jgi:hypothetical protein
MQLDVREARFASRGGTYYFVLRGSDIIPISDLSREAERNPTARGPRIRYVADVKQDDVIVEVEVGSAKAARRGQRGYLHVKEGSAGKLQGRPWQEWHLDLKHAPQTTIQALVASPNAPSWMKRRISSWGVWR